MFKCSITICWKDSSFLLNCLCIFVKKMFDYLWGFISEFFFHFIDLCIYYFINTTWSWLMYLEYVYQESSSILFSIFSNLFYIFSHLPFHIHFRISFLISTEEHAGILIEIKTHPLAELSCWIRLCCDFAWNHTIAEVLILTGQ